MTVLLARANACLCPHARAHGWCARVLRRYDYDYDDRGIGRGYSRGRDYATPSSYGNGRHWQRHDDRF